MSAAATPLTGDHRGHRLQSRLSLISALFIAAMLLWLDQAPSLLHWPARILFLAAGACLAFTVYRAFRASRWRARKAVFFLILAVFMYAAVHGMCLAFIKLMSARDESLVTASVDELTPMARQGIQAMLAGESPVQHDSDIGWVHRPGYQWKGHSITGQGLRGARIYSEAPADPAKRILCLGDSFTFGYEVADHETYPWHGEQLRPGTEWLNLGICGTGLVQSLQQYRKNGRKFGGKHVVIGFMTNNKKRTVNSFRPFISPEDSMTPLAKPFARFDNGSLSIEENPYQDIADYHRLLDNEAEELKRLHQNDYLSWSNQRPASNPVLRAFGYIWERADAGTSLDILLNRPAGRDGGGLEPGDDPYGKSLWHPDSPGFQASMKVFDLYCSEVIADGRVPLIVILPSAQDVEDRAAGRPPKHAALLGHLRELGLRHFDFLDILEARNKGSLKAENFFVKTHFNSETNKLIAEEVIKALGL